MLRGFFRTRLNETYLRQWNQPPGSVGSEGQVKSLGREMENNIHMMYLIC